MGLTKLALFAVSQLALVLVLSLLTVSFALRFYGKLTRKEIHNGEELQKGNVAVGIVLGQALRGAGDTKSPVFVTVVGAILVRLPLAWYLGVELGWGLSSVWWASLIDWIARTLLLVFLWQRGRWKRLELSANAR